jgi:hypothetical protein
VRLLAALLFAFPAAAAPLASGTPRLQLRLEGLVGQPNTDFATRAGGGLGAGFRLTDQLWVVADFASRAAPGGGINSVAAGLQATLDATPISPYLELAMVEFVSHEGLGYSLATRTGAGADWMFSRAMGVGVAVRIYTALDPQPGSPTVAGFEGALRFIYTPGAK